ncbi:hypothetical protein ES705_15354 [subsurface metagenome]
MTSDIVDIGIGQLDDEQLEELAIKIETQLHKDLRKHPQWALLSDFSILIKLSQDKDNILTLDLEYNTTGALTSFQHEQIHENLSIQAEEILKEALICLKNSKKS